MASDPSGMSITDGLVRAAAKALYGAAYGVASKRKGRLAVVAVLRALADEDCDWPSDELAALADDIESGGVA